MELELCLGGGCCEPRASNRCLALGPTAFPINCKRTIGLFVIIIALAANATRLVATAPSDELQGNADQSQRKLITSDHWRVQCLLDDWRCHDVIMGNGVASLHRVGFHGGCVDSRVNERREMWRGGRVVRVWIG